MSPELSAEQSAELITEYERLLALAVSNTAPHLADRPARIEGLVNAAGLNRLVAAGDRVWVDGGSDWGSVEDYVPGALAAGLVTREETAEGVQFSAGPNRDAFLRGSNALWLRAKTELKAKLDAAQKEREQQR